MGCSTVDKTKTLVKVDKLERCVLTKQLTSSFSRHSVAVTVIPESALLFGGHSSICQLVALESVG